MALSANKLEKILRGGQAQGIPGGTHRDKRILLAQRA
jgi:hypothetical protein